MSGFQKIYSRVLVAALLSSSAAMAHAATISGVVSSVGTAQPLAGATVTAGQLTCLPGFGCFFSSTASAQSLADGSYTIAGLNPATYVVVATATDHVSATYPDNRCYQSPASSCGAEGTPSVFLADAGSSATGIQFSMHPGGSIEGRVTAAATSLPIAGAGVTLQLFDGSSQQRGLVTAVTNAQGDYRFDRLRDSRFALVARAPDQTDYIGSIYPNTPCDNFSVSCNATVSAAQDIALSQALLGRDLSLLVGGRVRVHLSDSLTGAPIEQQVRMRLAANPQVFASAGSLAATPGRYDFGPIASTNVLLTFANFGSPDYGNELYDEVPCLNDACDLSAGTSIAVAAGALVQIQETLDPLRFARGRVVDGLGQPVPDVDVGAGTAGSGGLVAHFAIAFRPATRARSGPDGRFVLTNFGGGSGNYVRTLGNGTIIDGAAPGIECNTSNLFCKGSAPYTVLDFSSASDIDVGDIAVRPAARIRGTVRVQGTGTPATIGSVYVIRPGTRELALQAAIGPDGRYELGGLPAGSHLLLAEAPANTVAEIYRDIPCSFPASASAPNCDFAPATPVVVSGTQVRDGIDFFGEPPIFANGFEG